MEGRYINCVDYCIYCTEASKPGGCTRIKYQNLSYSLEEATLPRSYLSLQPIVDVSSRHPGGWGELEVPQLIEIQAF